MRQTLSLLAGVLLGAVSLGSDSPKEYDDATEVDELQGTWQIAAHENNGQQLAFHRLGIQTFRDGKWTYELDGKFMYEGPYVARKATTLGSFDETPTVGPEKGQTRLYIYQRTGDTLRTAFRQDRRARPKSFDEEGLFIIVWKRVGK